MHTNVRSFNLYQHLLRSIFKHIRLFFSTRALLFTRNYFGFFEMCNKIMTETALFCLKI